MPVCTSIIPRKLENNAPTPGTLTGLLSSSPGASVGPSAAALGTYGRLVSNSSEQGPSSPGARDGLALVERFRLQAAARRLLPLEGVAGCLRRRQAGKDFVELWHLPALMRAKYGGLQTCSSVYMCPVCAAKISERRRVEVAAAIDAWELQGGEVVMLTLTVRHTSSDRFTDLLDGLKRSLKRVYAGSQGMKFKGMGLRGTIGSTETTWGEGSGWHPHIHQLLFVDAGCPFDLFLMHYRKQWDAALRLEGMGTVTSAGVDMSFNKDHRADYVNKLGGGWDLEHELAKGPVKLGREGRYSPFQLLASFAAYAATGDVSHAGREHGRVFQAYALVMKGRHSLQWSRGLRGLLGLGAETSDADLADEKDAVGVLLARLSKKSWALVLHFDQRAQLLNAARGGSEEEVAFFLQELDWRFETAAEERRFRASTQDNRTEWDDQREAEADDLGLSRSEYLIWRRGGADALIASSVPRLPADRGLTGAVSGNNATLQVMVRRLVSVGRARVAALPLLSSADAAVEEGAFETSQEYGRNGYGERFVGL